MSINTSTSAAATAVGNNTLVCIASDGTALVAWYDGTNQQVSYAAAPYSSWTQAQLQAAFRFCCAMLVVDGSGNVGAITCDNVQGSNYYKLTKSGSAYSVGSPTAIGFVGTFSAGQPQQIALDPQGRAWSISNTNNGNSCQVWYSATPTTASSWVNSLSQAITNDAHGPSADIVGNYLVVVYYTSGSGLQYQRLDVHSATLGSWSSAATITLSGSPSNTTHTCLRGNGAGIGCLAYSTGTGIYAAIYTAATDTWSAASQLSSSGNDASPTIVADGSGNLYVFWCSYAAANSYALVYKKWNGSAWDSSATTVVASGTNITNPNAGYGDNTIGIVYTTGTASPYSVNFATISLAPKSSVNANIWHKKHGIWATSSAEV
jgi:hypothetical protein